MSRILIDALAILTSTLLLIFSAFLFSYKKGNTTSNKILAIFLLANSLYIIDFSLPAIIRVTSINLSWFDGFGISFGFLFGPLLYLYTQSITLKKFLIKPSHSIHLIPFIFFAVAVISRINISVFYLLSALYLQTTPYMFACLVLIIKYRRRIKNYFSSLDKLNLTWMLYVVGAFFIMWMVDLIHFISIYLGAIGHTTSAYLTFISLTINFVFAMLIFHKALQHPEIFAGLVETEKHPKYGQSRLTEIEKNEYLRKLKNYFDVKKPYLNPELTITEVAKQLNVSVKYLSQVINESLGKNFYDFINSYRIEEAKRQLTSHSTSKKTVLEVHYESGFNSKSAFNSAFKKHTGFTPTEYRKQPLIN